MHIDKVKAMSSYDAVKKIGYLQKYCKQNIINNVIKIYNDLDVTQRNEYVINALLKCFKKSYKAKVSMDHMKLIQSIKNSLVGNTKNENIDIYNKTSLIGIYSQFKDVKTATQIFNSIPTNKINIVTISAMMKCFMDNNQNEKAIELYEQSHSYVEHNDISNLLMIQACNNINDYNKAKKLINTNVFTDSNDISSYDIKLITTLIDFYGKNGDINDAVNLFNKIPTNKKDTACIGAMMKCFIGKCENEKAMSLYEQYNYAQDDTVNLLFIKACVNSGDYTKCEKLINSKIDVNDINKYSIEFITTLIDFYGKKSDINNAFNLFNKIASNKRNAVSLTVIMKYLIENNENKKAIFLYEQYNGKHNDRSDLLFIKACNNIGEYNKINKLISNIKDVKYIVNNRSIEFINNLIDFYCKNNDMTTAMKLFDSVPKTKIDAVTIAIIMKYFINNNNNNKAISLYESYDGQHDDVTRLLLLKACGNCGRYDKCEKIISDISDVNNCSLEFINTMIDYYGKISKINNALNLFDTVTQNRKDSVLINTMMNCLIDNDKCYKAMLLYKQYDTLANDTTNLLFLKACISIGDHNDGKKLIASKFNLRNIHNYSIEFITTLIDFYGKSGDVINAYNIFSNLSSNEYCVAAMMNAYNSNEQYDKAIDLFNKEKKKNNIYMNEYMCCILLDIAGSSVSLHFGSNIIYELNKSENIHLLKSLKVQAAIIRMYAKCSKFEEAIDVFDNINFNRSEENKKDALVLYASILDCYTKMGNVEEVLLLFNKLKQDELFANCIDQHIYCIVLNACSHSNRIADALSIFEEIKCKYKGNNIHPHIITTLIDCIGRNGDLKEAENMYKIYAETNVNIYYKFKIMMLLSLLSSCRIHNDIERGQRVFDMIKNIGIKYKLGNDVEAAMHIQMSNIYGQNRDFVKVNEIREIMKRKGLKKTAGISWIEINGKIHKFMVNDSSHPMYNEIVKEREILKNELKEYGHIFDESVITRELNENENIEDHLCAHSEKLAVIYGLITTTKKETLTIGKNLRICKDCHNAIKLISKIRNRKINVRDKHRWHIFKNGMCSCNDYF